ncbi:YceI family protein [Neorhizobium galegae]|uniref:YceI family protein n=1 Tax=Neorhizobium galegae TaxID=399 RepID=UPI0006217FC8|nr:YceI family protein [Neorhizobium galegae]KAA9382987.1 polyisoprenoid-binding protein [Neorhizobium galegae]MCM2498950.1 YceI family protein [Neorhizobium galegae]CDZ27826.1 YceI-like domain protein [Neorhizobium galegae bv. officinalis]CDZ41310.1 YceI-like domain protein [Neorhizobium galegae bv. officinalis]
MLRTTAFALALALSTTLALAAATHPAPGGVYKTDPSHSSFNWSFDHSGLSHYTARFTKVDARLDWKPERPETSTLSVTIDPLSVRTDYPWPAKVDFDAEIGGEETFLAAKPITFVSRTIHVTGEKTGTVEGLLTFRGETHPATLDVTFNGSMAEHPMMGVPKIGFSATGRIRRSEWGLDFAIPELGDVVTFAIETQMVPADYSFQ